MRRLRPTDGTAVHRRAAVYHMAKCRKGATPLHGQLRLEMKQCYDLLKLKARETEAGQARSPRSHVERPASGVPRGLWASDRSRGERAARGAPRAQGAARRVPESSGDSVAARQARRGRGDVCHGVDGGRSDRHQGRRAVRGGEGGAAGRPGPARERARAAPGPLQVTTSAGRGLLLERGRFASGEERGGKPKGARGADADGAFALKSVVRAVGTAR